MSKFDYPRLPPGEIIGILSEFRIANVSEANLRHPNSDLVTKLYSDILFHIDALVEDQNQMDSQIDFEALEQLENPDHHVDSVRIMNLVDKIREIVAAVECPTIFTVKDLVYPNGDRTEVFLSAILNFCLHRETKMNIYKPVVDEMSLVEGQKQQLEVRLEQLNGEIAECSELKEKEMPLVQEVDAKVKGLRQTIQSLNNQQMSLKVSVKKMKEKVKEMDEKIANAEFALVQSVQENGDLHSKIVQSPDKLQRALEEKRSLALEAKNAERTAMQAFQDKSSVVEIYTKACKIMSKQFDRMTAIQEQVNSVKSIEKDLKLLKVKLGDEEILYKSLEAKLAERKAKADQSDELKRQLQQERDIICEEAVKELKNVKLEVEAKKSVLESRQKQVEAVVTEADTVNTKINLVKESGRAQEHELRCKCEGIFKELYQYSSYVCDSLLGTQGGH